MKGDVPRSLRDEREGEYGVASVNGLPRVTTRVKASCVR